MAANDWRMDAMAEFFNVEFVRIGEDGEPMSNEIETREYPPDATPETKLSVNVLDMLVIAASEYHRWLRDGAEGDEEFTLTEWTDRIIALVRAAAWREFSEAMLSDKAIEAMRRAFVKSPTGRVWTGSITAALAAIAPEDSHE